MFREYRFLITVHTVCVDYAVRKVRTGTQEDGTHTTRGGSTIHDIDRILSYIDHDEVISVARELVAIPSITHHEGRGMVEYLSRWFTDLGIPVRLDEIGDGRANVFADFGAANGPGRFMFNGHMDTKPVDGMTIDPFGGEITGGRLYGRGACDMKGGIAAVLCAMKALVRSDFKAVGGITFFSDVEEEYDGGAGMLRARDTGLLDGYEGLISCEPSELEVQIGNRGCYITTFEAQGTSAHSALAHLGRNAVHDMVRFITEFRKLPYLTVENPYFGQCTLNFEHIDGGLYLSAVPDRCSASVDSRLIPEIPPETLQEQVHALIDRLNRDEGIDIRETAPPPDWRPGAMKAQAFWIDPEHPLMQRITRAFEVSTGREALISGCPAITIAGVAIGAGLPAVICGPGSLAQAHTADEWVDINQLLDAASLYAALMAGM